MPRRHEMITVTVFFYLGHKSLLIFSNLANRTAQSLKMWTIYWNTRGALEI